METLPCRNCITLPICKSSIFKDQVPYTLIFDLVDRCSICRKYCGMENEKLVLWWNKNMREVYNFFTGYIIYEEDKDSL